MSVPFLAVRGGLAGSGGQDGDGLWAGSYEVTSARLSAAEVVVQLPGRQITEKTSTTVESVKHEVRPGDCTTILIFTVQYQALRALSSRAAGV